MGKLYKNGMTLTTERLKVLKVVGEEVAQVVVENEVPIDAIKIDKIDATLRETEDHVFENKVVKQGIIHKQVFFVDSNNFVRHVAEDIPFMIAVDIPGVKPGPFVDVQNHLIDIDTDYQLVPSCSKDKIAVLRQKVVAHILVKVSEWSQVDVVTNVQIFPGMTSIQKGCCC